MSRKFTIRPAALPKIAGPVDVAIAGDGTGSTVDFKEGVLQSLSYIFDEIMDHASMVRVFLQVHGDHDDGQTEVLLTDGGTPAQALADLGSVVYGGGGDPAEHHLTAIERLVERVPWAHGARRVLLAFTTDDSKPSHSGRSATEIGQALKDARVLFHLVGHDTPTLRALVAAAGGFFTKISNDPDLEEMRRIGKRVGATLSSTLTRQAATRPASPPTTTV